MIQNKLSQNTGNYIKEPVFIFFILLLFLGCNNHKKKEPIKKFTNKIEELVLSENIERKEYIIKVDEGDFIKQYYIIYIGNLTIKKKINKVLYITTLTGISDSPQANSFLIFYDNQNNRLGSYYIGSVEMPKIQNDGLFFKYEGGECNQTTTISFKDSIPKEIFINCTEKGGDLYKFEEPDGADMSPAAARIPSRGN